MTTGPDTLAAHPAASLPAPFRQFWRAAWQVARGAADGAGERRLWWMVGALYAFLAVVTLAGVDTFQLPAELPSNRIWLVAWLPLVPWLPFKSALEVAVWLVPAVTALRPRSAALRWLALAVYAVFVAAGLSHRGIAHRPYLMLTALVFAALLPAPRCAAPPAAEEARRRRRAELAWAGIAFGLLFYSMSGATKLLGVVNALLDGDGFLLDFSRPPRQLWTKALGMQPPPLMSAWVLDHPALAKLGYFGVVGVELLSLPMAFSRRLLRPWLLLLAALHISTLLTMKIFFAHAFGVLLIWALLGPFPEPLRWPSGRARREAG